MEKPIVAIVGRPNVGKSCLFNRLLQRKIAVVDDFSGVTRDRNYQETAWNRKTFFLTDTGGLVPSSNDTITGLVRDQVGIAIAEAQVILFVVDVKTGPTDVDLEIAKVLRKGKKPVILVLNKSESMSDMCDSGYFQSLGFAEPLAVSALHGTGIGTLLDAICKQLDKTPEGDTPEVDPAIRIAILGRPNAGKSSLVNTLIKQKRMIVDSLPGTTRDAIDSKLTYHKTKFILIDTAGLRRKSQVKDNLEYYSNLRALDSIRRSDICVLCADAAAGFGEQDLKILEKINQMHRGVIVCLNKWDLVEKDSKTFDRKVAELRRSYLQLKHVPVLSISALTGQRVTTILDTALKIRERMTHQVSPADFRNNLYVWTKMKPHPLISGKQVRILGGKQVAAQLPVFDFFTNHPAEVKPEYRRYLTNNIQETYNFTGCPVVLHFKPLARPHTGVKNSN